MATLRPLLDALVCRRMHASTPRRELLTAVWLSSTSRSSSSSCSSKVGELIDAKDTYASSIWKKRPSSVGSDVECVTPPQPEQLWRTLNLTCHPTTQPNDRNAWIRRIKHAAMRRGWRETEQLIGGFVAQENLACEYTDEHLRQLERLLSCDDWFLTNLAVSRVQAPDELKCKPLERLQAYARRRQPSS